MSSASRHVYCCLIALMLIIVRTADAHAHLCADGREPPVSMHVGDGGNHPCETDPREDHSGDKDVQLASDVALKKAPQIDPWAATFLAFAFDVVAPVSDQSNRFHSTDDRFESIVYLRPPLRGPPA